MLKQEDLDHMETFGRYVARDDDAESRGAASYMYAIATDVEKRRLRMEYEEGIRNFTDSPVEVNLEVSALVIGAQWHVDHEESNARLSELK